MPMMFTVAVVAAHYSAVISGTKSVINKSQVVLGDGPAVVLPYLFADESFSTWVVSSTTLRSLRVLFTTRSCHRLGVIRPSCRPRLSISAQSEEAGDPSCTYGPRVARCQSAALRIRSEKSDARQSAEYPRHTLTENVGLHVGLSFPTIQFAATNRIMQNGLSLVPGEGIEPPQDYRPCEF